MFKGAVLLFNYKVTIHFLLVPGPVSDIKFRGSWSDYFEHIFKADQQMYCNQYEWMLDWSKNNNKMDILVLKYEDMKQDIVSGIKKIAAFLDIKLTEPHVKKIVHDASVKQMKSDKAIGVPGLISSGDHVRSGQSGGWKKYFTVEQNEWFDNKYRKLYQQLDIDVDYS